LLAWDSLGPSGAYAWGSVGDESGVYVGLIVGILATYMHIYIRIIVSTYSHCASLFKLYSLTFDRFFFSFSRLGIISAILGDS
jgi:hypothetical protein